MIFSVLSWVGSSLMLEIIYQDEYMVAVNKPAGMLVHRSWLDSKETVFVMQTLRDQIGQFVYPIHRLDRPTSGVLLFALSSDVARQLAAQFESHQIEKIYHAVVRVAMLKRLKPLIIHYLSSWTKLRINMRPESRHCKSVLHIASQSLKLSAQSQLGVIQHLGLVY